MKAKVKTTATSNARHFIGIELDVEINRHNHATYSLLGPTSNEDTEKFIEALFKYDQESEDGPTFDNVEDCRAFCEDPWGIPFLYFDDVEPAE